MCSISELKFSSWNVPKVDDIDMAISYDNFPIACEAGLEEFLRKLQNFEDLKVVISYNNNAYVSNFHFLV